MQCHLTAKDSFFLRSLLDSPDHDEAYFLLLRQKLDSSALFLDHTIDRRVATLDSRVHFTIGNMPSEERVLTKNEVASTQGLDLPVTTLTGLALVGLKEGNVFPLAMPGGAVAPIRLIKVAYQPEHSKRTDTTSTVVKLDLLRSVRRTIVDCDGSGPGAA